MLNITRDDIRGISDAASLIDFLRAKLALPIADDATLEQIARPFPLRTPLLKNAVADQVIDCWHFGSLPGFAPLWSLFLIRLKGKLEYPSILHAARKFFQRRDIDPAGKCFICSNECFQPFAFASFAGGEGRASELTIRYWGQEKTDIHVNFKHEIPAEFFQNTSSHTVASIWSECLLAKLGDTGTPLRREVGREKNICTGSLAQSPESKFLIDDSKRQQLIAADAKSKELIRPVLYASQQKWQTDLRFWLYIPHSGKTWPWSNVENEAEAERIFAETYPAIHGYLGSDRDELKTYSSASGRFYWESYGRPVVHPEVQRPKIVYPTLVPPMRASYDTTGALTQRLLYSILSDDLSLLAILNSKLLGWYAHTQWRKGYFRDLFCKEQMKDAPIASRTEREKAELSDLAQQILDAPDSHEVPALEEKIDARVYELYELTDAEIALIEGN